MNVYVKSVQCVLGGSEILRAQLLSLLRREEVETLMDSWIDKMGWGIPLEYVAVFLE